MNGSQLNATNSFKMSSNSLGASFIQSNPSDSKRLTNFFGRKNKNPVENSACLLACTINFLKTPDSKNTIQKLDKYMQRCKQIVTQENDKSSVQIADCQYLQIALHNLLLHAHLLPFEMKKSVYAILTSSLKISQSCCQYFATYAKSITFYLFQYFEKNEMYFFTGNVLRILLKQEFLDQMLDLQLLDSIIKVSKNAVFEIASEALETFHVIFKQKKPKQKEILSKFLLDNHSEVFKLFVELAETENYLAKRDILLTLNQILSDPVNKQFNLKFINDKENLKRVMTILSSEEQGGFKEVALILFDHFLQGFSTIENEKVKHIIERNKMLLIQCIKQCVNEANQESQGEQEDRKDYMIHILEEI
ncbi:calcium-binding-like protein (macronuclear) [Tetrahymena thermophila SB210]|uniref:Calcium-binding-like protein n=1 Tax=Tetrahymena thermophila (strain SB210) TaxID=312017 RepID=Q238X4_TETTS|nr:calcium-binding-like protein [Tetrahymena thermophila SB210]EAR93096.2 calcium-binding-like protein [Tetrahymena thermophila SB210]|eukprot:XP_001013341.2 calcium-binding-like protein [Tetrahymena thermophila SB210]